jgi:hypothetical protein
VWAENRLPLIQDLGWKLIESTEAVTDQLSMNWARNLTQRSGSCGPADRTSWRNVCETGALALRPLVIRLGLRDVMNPNFASAYGGGLANLHELDDLLKANQVRGGISQFSKEIGLRLQGIPTDFALRSDDRKLLDLVAFLLVHGKLAGDVGAGNEVRRSVDGSPPAATKFPL